MDVNAQAAARGGRCRAVRARSEAHQRELNRLREKIERTFDQDKKHQLDQKERSHGMNYGR